MCLICFFLIFNRFFLRRHLQMENVECFPLLLKVLIQGMLNLDSTLANTHFRKLFPFMDLSPSLSVFPICQWSRDSKAGSVSDSKFGEVWFLSFYFVMEFWFSIQSFGKFASNSFELSYLFLWTLDKSVSFGFYTSTAKTRQPLILKAGFSNIITRGLNDFDLWWRW